MILAALHDQPREEMVQAFLEVPPLLYLPWLSDGVLLPVASLPSISVLHSSEERPQSYYSRINAFVFLLKTRGV